MPALLYSLSEPGPDVPEAEFHDWYNNDHIPARIASPVFQSWTRWVAIDGQKPTFANTYDLESYEATKTPPYTRLAQERSEHELDLIKRVAHLEPRVYEEYPLDPVVPPSSLFDPENPAPFALFLSVDMPAEVEQDFVRWNNEEFGPHVSKLPGWVRSRNYKLRDWKRLGVEGSKDQTAPSKYLAIHEFATPEVAQNPSLLDAPKTPLYEKFAQGRTARSRRAMKFLKKFERE